MTRTAALHGAISSTHSAHPTMQRCRTAERALWDRHGLEPSERFIEIGEPAATLRVVEVGSGEPVLFVHGTAGPGSWPSLVRGLSGLRCILLERPGWGLSSPIDYARQDYKTTVAGLLNATLDALHIDRAHVVGSSIGNTWALALAARHPPRVRRTVLIGGGPLLPEIQPPPFIRLLASPLGALVVRVPAKPKMIRAQLRQIGHGDSLDAGRISDEYIHWRLALDHDTDSMRHERDMVRAIAGVRGFRPGLTFDDAELAAIQQPTLHVYGTTDPVGTIDAYKREVDVLPRGELALVEDAGHMPWFDDSRLVAARIHSFLT